MEKGKSMDNIEIICKMGWKMSFLSVMIKNHVDDKCYICLYGIFLSILIVNHLWYRLHVQIDEKTATVKNDEQKVILSQMQQS